MREIGYTGVILKKQPFGEADEIITIFTKEKGKVRVLAKSIKLQKSKLSGSLQNLFLVEIFVAGKTFHLQKLIGARVLNNFANLRQDLQKLKYVFYAQEMVLKFTADEHKNTELFNLFLEYLEYLDNQHKIGDFGPALAKFKIEFLENSGLKISYDKECLNSESLGFSSSKGGFIAGGHYRGKNLKPSFELFLNLKDLKFGETKEASSEVLHDLQEILSSFVEYQLERQVKSEKYLKA